MPARQTCSCSAAVLGTKEGLPVLLSVTDAMLVDEAQALTVGIVFENSMVLQSE